MSVQEYLCQQSLTDELLNLPCTHFYKNPLFQVSATLISQSTEIIPVYNPCISITLKEHEIWAYDAKFPAELLQHWCYSGLHLIHTCTCCRCTV